VQVVKGIDAVSRERIAQLVAQGGLQQARIPLLLPGAILPVALSPTITAEDRAVRIPARGCAVSRWYYYCFVFQLNGASTEKDKPGSRMLCIVEFVSE
jgi:hypothetical protein